MGRSLNLWLLVLLLVCAASVWFGRDLFKPDPVTPGQLPLPSPRSHEVTETEEPVHVLVLNGTDVSGLARQVSLLATRVGCVIEGVGNADGLDGRASFLVNRRLSDRRALDLAKTLGDVPVIREWDNRCSEDAVLVLGSDYDRVLGVLQQ